VSNHVGQIQELTEPVFWNHVKTKENSADAISRGISPMQLIQSQLWWNGPHGSVVNGKSGLWKHCHYRIFPKPARLH